MEEHQKQIGHGGGHQHAPGLWVVQYMQARNYENQRGKDHQSGRNRKTQQQNGSADDFHQLDCGHDKAGFKTGVHKSVDLGIRGGNLHPVKEAIQAPEKHLQSKDPPADNLDVFNHAVSVAQRVRADQSGILA